MKKNKNDQNNGIAIGISLGLIFGLLFDNIAFGLLIGIAFGGLVIKKNNKRQKQIINCNNQFQVSNTQNKEVIKII